MMQNQGRGGLGWQCGSPMLCVVRRNSLGRQHETRGNLERGEHGGAMMMPAFKTPSRILSSAKTFP